jgi:hypothetical protein
MDQPQPRGIGKRPEELVQRNRLVVRLRHKRIIHIRLDIYVSKAYIRLHSLMRM